MPPAAKCKWLLKQVSLSEWKPVKNNYKIKPGDAILLLSFSRPEDTDVKPENIPLNIVYEDDVVMVLNKPSNMVVHPGVGNYTGTLLNGIAYHLLQQNPSIDEDHYSVTDWFTG